MPGYPSVEIIFVAKLSSGAKIGSSMFDNSPKEAEN